MASNGSEHRERAGACSYCFEEWPCAVARGEATSSGIQKEHHDRLLEEALAESIKLNETIKYINEVFERHEIPVEICAWSRGQMISTDDLLKIATRLDDETLWE